MYLVRRELDATEELNKFLSSRRMSPERLRALVFLSTGDAHQADLAQATLIREYTKNENGNKRKLFA